MTQQKSFETTLSSVDMDAEWDEFALRTPTAHHEQTSLWGDVQRAAGWRAVRLMVRRRGVLIGGAQILEKPVGRFGWTVGYLNRGPLSESDDPDLVQLILDGIKRHAKRRRMIYLALVPPYDGHRFEGGLLRAGFSISPPALPPSTPMRSTIVLDLTTDTEKMLTRMRKTTRQGIRKGLERGITVRQGGAADLDTFERLLTALCLRRSVQSNVPLNNFVPALWAKFAPGRLQLFIAEKDREPVAAALLFSCGRWARFWRFGWSGKYAEDCPNQLIYWEAIKWAKAHGFQIFDFVGFDSKYAQSLMDGPPLPQAEICQASFFKLGFGGELKLLHPNYCYFTNPIIRFGFNKFGARLIGSKIFRALGKKSAARSVGATTSRLADNATVNP